MPASAYFSFYPLSARCATFPPKEEAKLHVILSDSEESHRRTDRHILYHFGCGIFRLRSICRVFPPSREIASLRSQRQYIRLVDSSVGYFAIAQYDALGLGTAAALRASQ